MKGTRLRTFAKLILIVGVLAGVAACDEQPVAGGEEQLPQSAPGSQNLAGAVDATTAPPDSLPAGGPVAPTVLATREFTTARGEQGRVEITHFQRQGKGLVLMWTFTNLGDERWFLGDIMGAWVNDWSVAGTTLVDPVNGKRYLVARAERTDGPWICSRRVNVYLEPGQSIELNATFAAPPPGVTQLNVDIPTVGVILDVPVS